MADIIIARAIPEQIADRLRRDMEAHELLRKKDIAERFGVSRGPIREVFRQLTQQGLYKCQCVISVTAI